MRPQLYEFLAAGAFLTLVLAWFAYPGHIFRSRTRTQQKISYLLALGLATGLALATLFRRLVPSLSCPASNALAWIPITLSALAAVFVQATAFGLVFWLVWSVVSQFGALA
jgi:uncharacterized membrane protein